jgi:hypothetical protein
MVCTMSRILPPAEFEYLVRDVLSFAAMRACDNGFVGPSRDVPFDRDAGAEALAGMALEKVRLLIGDPPCSTLKRD